MKTIKNRVGGGILRNRPAMPLLIGAVSLLFAVSCQKLGTQADDPENFVNLSISGVSDGHFTVDFQAGKNTKTIEYAVCYAVNMKADSVAFMEGSLDNIRQAVPGADGKVSVSFDFSDPLDLGPYTVYARAISGSGQTSRFVKEQVCALTTGVTVEYVSRSHYRMKASYHRDEFIAGAYRNHEQSWGSLEEFLNYMIHDEFIDFEHPAYDDGEEFYVMFQDNCSDPGVNPYPDDQWFGFITSNGTRITGAHAFKIPLQEYDTSIPLPDSVKVTVDYSNPSIITEEYEDGSTYFGESFPVEISMGDNIDSYFYYNFGWNKEEFMEFFRENIMGQYPLAEDEMLKWYLTGGAYYPEYNKNLSFPNNGIGEHELTFHSALIDSDGVVIDEYYTPSPVTLIVCPLNWNDETIVCFVDLEIPEEYLKGAKTTDTGTKSTGKKVTFTAPVTYYPEILHLISRH